MKSKEKIQIYDVTLRDGNHSLKHQISEEQIREYISLIDNAGIDFIEVGHGNGLSASSLLVGLSAISDRRMLEIARENITNAKLSTFMIPGFASVGKDLKLATEIGVDNIRIGALSTELNTTYQYIDECVRLNKDCEISIMMCHLLDKKQYLSEVKKLIERGSNKVTIMDSTGTWLVEDWEVVIGNILSGIEPSEINLGIHAHNNLGMATANTLAAIKAGARSVDASILGIGGGAGNLQLEVFAAVANKINLNTTLNYKNILRIAETCKTIFNFMPASINPINISLGMNKTFGGFQNKILEAKEKYPEIDIFDLIDLMGEFETVPGQEYIIDHFINKILNK